MFGHQKIFHKPADVDIHNNLCFYYLSKKDNESRRKAKNHYKIFKEIQLELENDIKKWHPLKIDTDVWAQWELFKDKLTSDEKEKLISRLELALKNSNLLEVKCKETIVEHLYKIENNIS